jgi:hypothetical protein
VLVDAASGQPMPDAVALSVLVVTSSWCVVFVNLVATDWAENETEHGAAIHATPPNGIVIVTSHEPALQLMILSVQVPVVVSVIGAVVPPSVYLQLASNGLPEMLVPLMVPVKLPEEHVTV